MSFSIKDPKEVITDCVFKNIVHFLNDLFDNLAKMLEENYYDIVIRECGVS